MKDRYPVGVVRVFVDSSSLDVNVHPSKREVRFDDEAKVASVVKGAVEKAIEGPDLSFKYDLTKFSESFTPSTGVPASAIVDAVQTTLKVPESPADDGQHALIVPLAQIMDTYILAESKGNLLLVDQHAASERIVYEMVLDSIETGKEISQTLITPLVIRLSASEERVVEENREALEKAGFKIDRSVEGHTPSVLYRPCSA